MGMNSKGRKQGCEMQGPVGEHCCFNRMGSSLRRCLWRRASEHEGGSESQTRLGEEHSRQRRRRASGEGLTWTSMQSQAGMSLGKCRG